MSREFVRFLAVGAVKTVVTSLAFYALAAFLPPRAAFTIVYVASLAFVTFATPRFIFQTQASHSKLALLVLWYIGIYFVGLGVVSALESISDARAVIVVGTVAVTAPLGFIGARYIVGSAPPLRVAESAGER